MSLFLFFYVILFLTLNFYFDDSLFFLLALSTFPVSVYLLVTKPKAKQKTKKTTSPDQPATTKIIESKEQNLQQSSQQR